jgi:glycosyltransferase involved in cell wall biosynthesis
MKKIIFIKQDTANAKFVTNDIDILSHRYSIDIKNVKTKKGIGTVIALIRQFFNLLFTTSKYDLIYIWFADFHSLLPVFFSNIYKKPCIICIGGYEATWIPEINCGVYTDITYSKKFRKFCVTYSLKYCTLILPVDESLVEHKNEYVYSDTSLKLLYDGIKNFIPELTTEIKIIHPGFDYVFFKRKDNIIKSRSVISVGYVPNEYEIKRKGFDLLFESAKIMTDTKFIFVGLQQQYIDKFASFNLTNLEMYSSINYNELIDLYSSSKVYAQFSLFEGFPSAICEAMLCECIPVASNVNGLPKIVNGYGVLICKKNIQNVINALNIALNYSEKQMLNARKHIIENFPLSKRINELKITISKYLRN